jgi:hypothetical protein
MCWPFDNRRSWLSLVVVVYHHGRLSSIHMLTWRSGPCLINHALLPATFLVLLEEYQRHGHWQDKNRRTTRRGARRRSRMTIRSLSFVVVVKTMTISSTTLAARFHLHVQGGNPGAHFLFQNHDAQMSFKSPWRA